MHGSRVPKARRRDLCVFLRVRCRCLSLLFFVSSGTGEAEVRADEPPACLKNPASLGPGWLALNRQRIIPESVRRDPSAVAIFGLRQDTVMVIDFRETAELGGG